MKLVRPVSCSTATTAAREKLQRASVEICELQAVLFHFEPVALSLRHVIIAGVLKKNSQMQKRPKRREKQPRARGKFFNIYEKMLPA
jgi:hypothetical protein